MTKTEYNRQWRAAHPGHEAEYHRRYRAAHPANLEQIAERDRRYRGGHRGTIAESVRRYRAAHPEKRAAQVAVAHAIQSGLLTRQPCCVCGGKAEAHHEDYSKPLGVVWLCRRHHMARHRELLQGLAA